MGCRLATPETPTLQVHASRRVGGKVRLQACPVGLLGSEPAAACLLACLYHFYSIFRLAVFFRGTLPQPSLPRFLTLPAPPPPTAHCTLLVLCPPGICSLPPSTLRPPRCACLCHHHPLQASRHYRRMLRKGLLYTAAGTSCVLLGYLAVRLYKDHRAAAAESGGSSSSSQRAA